MSAIIRLWGSGASLCATLLQLAAIAATTPALDCRSLCWLGGHPGPVELYNGWEPYIENADVGALPLNGPRCPGRQAASGSVRLDHAPLPAGFDAHAYPNRDILACVKLGAGGTVEAVRIIAGTGRHRLDTQLLRSIHRQWRFRPVDGVAVPHWQRIRLNSGYRSAPPPEVLPPPYPLL